MVWGFRGLGLRVVYVGNSIKMALNWELKVFYSTLKMFSLGFFGSRVLGFGVMV